ncbi:hypothetical protein [Streptomyces boluensis]|uniref:Uncharacterized protein n=1 Tax=Streptomyces boluensis TaxID=1775135 RepID=A0A964XK28_9ACTN|nr:hypothetical protein [Streptomyces boluensis]NBE50661.1 hypothetical protein [Streptomyces boluensis]
MTASSGGHRERVARLEPLIDACRPLLAGAGGMAAVQRLLSEREVAVLDAVVITRELLGAGPGALAEAKAVVLTSPGRGRELRVHEQFMAVVARDGDSHEDGDRRASRAGDRSLPPARE